MIAEVCGDGVANPLKLLCGTVCGSCGSLYAKLLKSFAEVAELLPPSPYGRVLHALSRVEVAQ